ncbi:DNA polymerase III subunit beta [Desertihabitans brevis]|uniref:Beta sliding clamp n=1 Tax=Desertihabitans brevis TaxID=2268447 RepID=A0A367YWS9_9ACTN|nr:DNA polymerase III subunit beta [Desertihabitans brevis]RCK70355.1 DNA polymerase III subunit beta [Desertihabitans brevis]
MKIRLERDVLAEAVQWAARSLPTRPSVPILAGLLLRTGGGEEGAESVVLSSFDYETSTQVHARATVTDEGQALVSGRLLADICRSLPNKPVDISAVDSRMELICGSARFTLQTLPVADYPNLPTMPEQTGTIASDEFARAVSQVVVAAGRDELLPVFTGVRMEIDGETVSLLATDRYRMALKELTWSPANPSAGGAALVPAKVLADTARSMTAGENVSISLSAASQGDGLIGFQGTGAGGERETTTRLLDGEFPKVRHLMSIQPQLTVRGNTAEIIDAAKRVALVAERNTPLRMLIGDGSITLEAATGDQAQASEALEATVDLHGAAEPSLDAAGFNPNYLLDALGALDAPYVDFAFTAPGKPCLLTGLAELDGEPQTDYRHVIMLMRLPATR